MIKEYKTHWSIPKNIGYFISSNETGHSKNQYKYANFSLNVGDNKKSVESNINELKNLFSINNIAFMNQLHTNKTRELIYYKNYTNGDAIFTRNKKIACAVLTADCIPLLITDRLGSFVGCIHAGWRGLVNGILTKSAFTLTEKKYNLMEFEILIGPSIQSCCFEVGNDVVDQFDRQFIIPKSDEKFQVDLQQSAYNSLSQLGFDINKITIMNDCTFCLDSMYHSYRRNGKNAGRMIGLIGIK